MTFEIQSEFRFISNLKNVIVFQFFSHLSICLRIRTLPPSVILLMSYLSRLMNHRLMPFTLIKKMFDCESVIIHLDPYILGYFKILTGVSARDISEPVMLTKPGVDQEAASAFRTRLCGSVFSLPLWPRRLPVSPAYPLSCSSLCNTAGC